MKTLVLAVIVLAAALALPAPARAATVCVWNYDTLDRWYDSEVGDSINTAYWVTRTLSRQGHVVFMYNSALPADLSNFDVVFCLMGWYRC